MNKKNKDKIALIAQQKNPPMTESGKRNNTLIPRLPKKCGG